MPLVQMILLGILLLFSCKASVAQSSLKTKTYRFNSNDSVLVFQSEKKVDEKGRIRSLDIYHYYYGKDKQRLKKEEHLLWMPSTQSKIEKRTTYDLKNNPKTERQETQYLSYGTSDLTSKAITSKHFNDLGNLISEDTLTYSMDGQLIKSCRYNYKGSTSLLCDQYTYNKKKQKRRWKTYSIWTTVSLNQKVVTKKTKRRDFKYKYNKKGLLKSSCGVYYKRKHKGEIRYDKAGNIIKRRYTQKYKRGKKQVLNVEEDIYRQGRIVSKINLINKVEIEKRTYSYNDTLLIEQNYFKNAKLRQKASYIYDEDQGLDTITQIFYTEDKKPYRTVVYSYNTERRVIAEEHYSLDRLVKQVLYKYTSSKQLLEQKTFGRNRQLVEKTMYIYNN